MNYQNGRQEAETSPLSRYPLEEVTRELLSSVNFKPEDARTLAECVKKLSDFYIAHPSSQTPWTERWCVAAYLSYFLPLNWWRVKKAYSRLLPWTDFWAKFDHLIDYGSGLGTSLLGMDAQDRMAFSSIQSVEISKEAILLQRKILSMLGMDMESKLSFHSHEPQLKNIERKTLAVFSYSLTELASLPSWTQECDGLILIEPSTKQDSLKLISFRQQLIASEWKILAPCTHQLKCPLENSLHGDWCHDRTEWQKPSWFSELEKNLPMKNGTLSFSYLVAVKGERVFQKKFLTELTGDFELSRLTGDLQKFKGHSKQLVCRGPEREFLSFQDKHFPKNSTPHLPRGDLVGVAPEVLKKSNEVRVTMDSQLIHLSPPCF